MVRACGFSSRLFSLGLYLAQSFSISQWRDLCLPRCKLSYLVTVMLIDTAIQSHFSFRLLQNMFNTKTRQTVSASCSIVLRPCCQSYLCTASSVIVRLATVHVYCICCSASGPRGFSSNVLNISHSDQHVQCRKHKQLCRWFSSAVL